MLTKKALWSILLLSLIFSFTASKTAADQRPDTPKYAVDGQYAVGTMDFVIEDAERPLNVTVWYPVEATGAPAESHIYALDSYPRGLPADAFVEGHAQPDAAPASTDAPFPLVVYSHGYGGYRLNYIYLTEHLASYGFVVIAPDHFGNTTGDRDVRASTLYFLRPQDIQRTINFADTLKAAGGELEGLIDTDHIAVSGHSFGGYTALAAGGAQLDLEGFETWCDNLPTTLNDSTTLYFCSDALNNRDNMAETAGLDSPPDGLWALAADPRVDAIVAMAPLSIIFAEDGMAAVTIPTMILTGSADATLIPELHAYRAYEALGSAEKRMAVFENADHAIFADKCNAAGSNSSEFRWCSDPVWDMDRAHDLTNHFTTAFLLSILYDDEGARRALQQNQIKFTGVRYESNQP